MKRRKEYRTRRAARFQTPAEQLLSSEHRVLTIEGTVDSSHVSFGGRYVVGSERSLGDFRTTGSQKSPASAAEFEAVFGVRPAAIWLFDEPTGSVSYDSVSNHYMTSSNVAYGAGAENGLYDGDLALTCSNADVQSYAHNSTTLNASSSLLIYSIVTYVTGQSSNTIFGKYDSAIDDGWLVATSPVSSTGAFFYVQASSDGDGGPVHHHTGSTAGTLTDAGGMQPLIFSLYADASAVTASSVGRTGVEIQTRNPHALGGFDFGCGAPLTVGNVSSVFGKSANFMLHYLAVITGSAALTKTPREMWLSGGWA